jgi:hypothetical protein
MQDLLRLHLRELLSLSPDSCQAVFESDQGDVFETTFTVERGDVVTASDDGNLMSRFDGSAEEARRVIRAVIAFCDAP